MTSLVDRLKPLLQNLESDRMYFELVEPAHLKDIATYLSDDEVRTRMRLETLSTPEQQQKWFDFYASCRQKGEMVQWTGFSKDNGSFVSLLTLKEISWEDHRAEIGYSVNKSHWGQGLATEAATQAHDYAFKVLNLHTLYAQISPDNLASQGVIKKLGFEPEAHLKECFSYKGKFYDLLQYSKVNPWH